MQLPPWPNAMIPMGGGRTMFLRVARKDEVPSILPYLKKVMECDHDFYDIVGVRVYAELLGWYRERLKDPYVILGIIDGKLAGLANGRMWNREICISHHTMTFQRAARIGVVMYYAKAYYAFEVLGCQEFWSTFESYNGFRMGFQMCQPSYTWPEHQHELGGAAIYYVTRDSWNERIKGYCREMMGSDLIFDGIPAELVQASEHMQVPEEVAL